jgi:hypothetical protein
LANVQRDRGGSHEVLIRRVVAKHSPTGHDVMVAIGKKSTLADA